MFRKTYNNNYLDKYYKKVEAPLELRLFYNIL